MLPDKYTSNNFITIVYESTLSGFYFYPQQLKLVEDGAPIHRSSLPLQWRQAHGMAKRIWPANSPDLNPIETLWKIVKDLLRHHPTPKNKEEMAQTIQLTWDAISLQ
jgi:transposase